MDKNMFKERLKLARLKAGLSLDNLAKEICKKKEISKNALSKYERGEMMPSSDILILLTQTLNVSLDFLFNDQVLKLEKIEFRKKSSTPKKELNIVEANALDSIGRYLSIENILELKTAHADLPFKPKIIHTINEAENLANELRKQWNLGIDPIVNLAELLEEKGIKVLMIDLPEKVSGFTCNAVSKEKDSVPIIIVNKNHNIERKRFTLAHELAHRFIDDASFDAHEKLCEKASDCFAGAFLMPAEHLIQEAGQSRTALNPPEVFNLKYIYRVSAIAMLYRLKQINTISEQHFHYALMTYAQSWRKSEPEPLPDNQLYEVPKRFERLCYRALAENFISIPKCSELLQIPINDILKALQKEAPNINPKA